MEAKKIQLKTLFASVSAVLLLEALGAVLPFPRNAQLLAITTIRILDIAILLVIVYRIEGNLSCIGIRRTGNKLAFQKGVLWSVAFGLLSALGALLLLAFSINPLHLLKMKLPGTSISIILFFFVGGIIGPAAEEIFFRGLIFGFFRRQGFLLALALSTILFAALHPMSSQIPIPQLVGGILFASAFEIEKNLLAPTMIHILGNLAIFSISVLSN